MDYRLGICAEQKKFMQLFGLKQANWIGKKDLF
jgi:hypothetical protein